jgi:hypothetical protein
MPDQLSDVKTVTYFVNNPGSGNAAGGTGAGGDQQSGLVRRELDRAVAAWSDQQGSAALPPPLAPEVGRISFSYFDGSQWATEWDTVSNGGLPVAVRVEIAMSPRPKKGLLSSSSNQPFVEDPKHIYSMVVFLPSSQAARANPMPASTEESTDDSSGSSGTSGGSSGTGSTSGSGTSGSGSKSSGGTGTSGTGGKPAGSGTSTGGMGGATGGASGKPSGSGTGTGGTGGTGTGTGGTSKRGG